MESTNGINSHRNPSAHVSLFFSSVLQSFFLSLYTHKKVYIHTQKFIHTHKRQFSSNRKITKPVFPPPLRDKKKMGIIPSDIDSIFMVLGGCGWKGAWAMLKGRNADLIDFSILREFLHHAIFLVVLN